MSKSWKRSSMERFRSAIFTLYMHVTATMGLRCLGVSFPIKNDPVMIERTFDEDQAVLYGVEAEKRECKPDVNPVSHALSSHRESSAAHSLMFHI
jgi:hypothetical protein